MYSVLIQAICTFGANFQTINAGITEDVDHLFAEKHINIENNEIALVCHCLNLNTKSAYYNRQ